MQNQMLVQELIGVQKTVVNHEHVMQNVMNYLHTMDARQRRDSKVGAHFGQPGPTENGAPPEDIDQPQPQISTLEDEPALPLQEASKLLNDLNADVQLNYKNLEHMNDLHSRNGAISTPPPDGSRERQRAPPSAGSSTSMGYAKVRQGDADGIVYPVGQTNGIDPMYSEHINNIPYPMPPKDHSHRGNSRGSSSRAEEEHANRSRLDSTSPDLTCRRRSYMPKDWKQISVFIPLRHRQCGMCRVVP